MRYLVERTNDEFDSVGADNLQINGGGSLVFSTGGVFEVAYAAGQWMTVVPEDDE